jgi:Oxidoreductase family, NAD-binding Rossmann fold
VDTERTERGRALVEKAQGPSPRVYQDIRRLFEDKDVDAVSISTCNHWHALAAVWTCREGKDVYVEKPASHTLQGGCRWVEAARKYNRIVQCGLQARSIAHYRRAVELVREGAIGKPSMARVICFRGRLSIGRKLDGPIVFDSGLIYFGSEGTIALDATGFHSTQCEAGRLGSSRVTSRRGTGPRPSRIRRMRLIGPRGHSSSTRKRRPSAPMPSRTAM